MSIIVSKFGENARRIERTVVESEDYLQRYIYNNPDCLPLDDYKEDIQLLILAREFPTGSGPIDALGVDQDGEIYLIETKLYKNPDKRLVLAQVLDYGASLWRTYGDPQEFINRLQKVVQKKFDMTLQKKFDMTLQDKFEQVFAGGEWDTDEYLNTLKENVASGSFRYVVLMDQISDRLKDLINYMNLNSRFDIFGVELDFYKYEDQEILIPNLYGAEVKKSVGSSSGSSKRRNWDEELFFVEATKGLSSDQIERVRKLYSWTIENGIRVTWGTGYKRGSFSAKFDQIGQKSVFSVFTDGELHFNFAWLDNSETALEFRKELGTAIRRELPEFNLPENFISEFVRVPVDIWTKKVEILIEILGQVFIDDLNK